MEPTHKNCKPHRITDGIEEKQCNTCMNWKDLSKYAKATTWDKLDRACKECKKIYRERNKATLLVQKKTYRDTHKEERKAWLEANKESQNAYNKDYQAKYRIENKEKLTEMQKEYYIANKEKVNQRCREWSQANRDKINEYQKQRRRTDPNFRLAHNMRTRIVKVLNGSNKSADTETLIGCPADFLRDHLELQFKNGMTWDNYGEWHVDHNIPCAIFNLEDPDEQLICFNYSNLQPMWATDNLSKNDDVSHIVVEKLPTDIPANIIERIKQRQELARLKNCIK